MTMQPDMQEAEYYKIFGFRATQQIGMQPLAVVKQLKLQPENLS